MMKSDVMTARQALKLGNNQQLMIPSEGNSKFCFSRISFLRLDCEKH